jgi:nitroimidazol reductase NimA-like FMN-containing flavoprotein (pyridoxamine 5'-phosphate oxidase superfamily)
MPSRRQQIAMSPAEAQAWLASQTRIILVTNGAEGFPHPVPMNFALDDEGRVLMLSFARSRKVANLAADPRATLLVESGAHYAELKAVMLYTRAEIISPNSDAGRAEFDRCRAHFATKPQTTGASDDPTMRAAIAASMAKRVILRFTPERMVSWDHTRLGGVY